MKPKNIAEFLNFLTEEIHLNFYMFPFKITSLSFQYKNKTVRAKAQAIEFRLTNLEYTFTDSIQKSIYRLIENNSLVNEEFDFEYDRVKLNDFINTERTPLIDWFNNFIYQFSFIDSCHIYFNRDKPFLTSINDFNSLTTKPQENFNNTYAQDLMLLNLKEVQITEIQSQLEQNLDFIQNRAYFNLITYSMRGLIYLRSDYEASLKTAK